MIADKLRQAILQAAIQGKLTKQLKSDGTAKDLLAKIQAEKFQLIKEGKIKKERQIADISKEDIPCEIPANWLWCKLGDIAFVTKLAGFEYTSTISVNLKKTGIPLFKGKNIQNGKLDFNFESYIPENISDSLLRSQINKRCLLTPYVGTIGNIAIFDGSFKAHLGSNVGKIELFNNIDSHVYEEYLLIYLKSDIGLSELKKHKKATAQESISIEAIRDVDIPLPPLAEQKRIVARIESLLPELDKLEKEETRLATMQQAFPKAMKNSLLQAAIQGKLTKQLKSDGDAEDLLANIQAERKKLIKKGKIKKEKALPEITKEEEPFDIPDNWVWVRLGNIVYNRGQKKPDNEFTYIDISSINNKRSELGTLSNVLSPNKAPSRARKIVGYGDIIYATVRPYLHNTCIIDKNITPEPIVSTGFAVFCTLPQVVNRYLFRYLLSPAFDSYANSNENSKGVAYPAINDKKLLSAIVPLPPLAEQERIVKRLNELLPLCDEL